MERGETDFERAIDAIAAGRDFARLTAKHDIAATFPWRIWEALLELGASALELREADGGLGLPLTDVVRALERMAYHSIAASTAYFTFAGFGSHVLSGLDADRPLRSLVAGIATGEVRTALSLTEPGGGSDLAMMRTRLVCSGDVWRISGSKMYTTLAEESTHLIVAGLVDGGGTWRERLALAVIARNQAGVTINRVSTEVLRTCPTYEIAYDDVMAKADQVIEPGLAFELLTSTLNLERLAVAAQSCGLAARALEDAVAYARLREVSAGTLLDFQVVRHQLVDAWQALFASRALLDNAVAAVAAGEDGGVLPTMAQRQAAMTAHSVADLNVQLHGGAGLTTDGPAQRIWRDTRLHLIGPVAQAASADYLGHHILRNLTRQYANPTSDGER